MKLENRTQLELLREKCKESVAKEPCRVLVCGGTGCLAGGSQKIYERFQELSKDVKAVEVEFGPEIAHKAEETSGTQ
jgi:NADH-quinone oxidoreductase subunit F